jgi:hypothetical protein
MTGGAAPAATTSAMTSTMARQVPAGHEKTAVFATGAVAAPDFEKTAVHQANVTDKPAPSFEKTAVHQTSVVNRPGPATSTTPDLEI